MKSLDQFISDWTGKYCEMGGSASATNQCVDLANAYITECLELPAIFWTNAQDFPKKAGDKYDYILNTPEGIPNKGDLMIFKSPDGVGHISIFVNGGASRFNSFDQNFPTGSAPKICSHNYTNVLGWLRAKPVISKEQIEKDLLEQKQQVSNLQTQVNGLLVDLKSWETKYNECNAQRIEATSSSDGFRRQFNDFVAQLATKLGTRQEVPLILAAVDTCIAYEDANTELQRRMEIETREHNLAISDLGKELASVKSQLSLLEVKYREIQQNNTQPSIPRKNLIEIIKKVLGI